MKFVRMAKWAKRIIAGVVFLAALAGGLLGYTLVRTERALDRVNAFILRGDLFSAEVLLTREENFLLYRAKDRFVRLRDGRIKLARCRVLYGLSQFDAAQDACLDAVAEVKTSDEKFLAHYYAALSTFNRGLSATAGAGAATDAIHYLKEALKVKEDGEAQALLALLLEEEAKFNEMMRGPKEKGVPKDKPRLPSLFREEGGDGAGTKEKGY